MFRNKNTVYLVFILFLLPRCIEPYVPYISTEASNKYVVSGQITDVGGYQFVNVSLSSPVGNPHYIPVLGCFVSISDNKDHVFSLEDVGQGNYRAWIDQQYLIPGTSYMLKIKTPDGIEIESDYDQMYRCPDIDSVYYIKEDLPTNDPLIFNKGIQFYVDLNGTNLNSYFYRWDLEETWEYHSSYPKEWTYDGEIHQIKPPDYSRMVCWSTQTIKNIYTLTTQNLSENKYKKLPLHFVDNTTSRLTYLYSLLVKQYALSESGYTYWEQLRINSNDQGGMYSKQPLAIQGNIKNITHPNQSVLGFFAATSIKSKRIFIKEVDGLIIDYKPICAPTWYRKGFLEVEE